MANFFGVNAAVFGRPPEKDCIGRELLLVPLLVLLLDTRRGGTKPLEEGRDVRAKDRFVDIARENGFRAAEFGWYREKLCCGAVTACDEFVALLGPELGFWTTGSDFTTDDDMDFTFFSGVTSCVVVIPPVDFSGVVPVVGTLDVVADSSLCLLSERADFERNASTKREFCACVTRSRSSHTFPMRGNLLWRLTATILAPMSDWQVYTDAQNTKDEKIIEISLYKKY